MKNLIAVALSVAGLSAFGGGGSVDSAGSCVSFSSAASAVGFCAASAAAPLRIVIPTPAKVCFSGEEFETDGFEVSGNIPEYARETGRAMFAGRTPLAFRRDRALGSQAYRINAAREGVCVTAGNESGAIYAVQTLRQLAVKLPNGRFSMVVGDVDDKPVFAVRGVNWNMFVEARSWSMDDGHGIEDLKRRFVAGLDTLSFLKLNAVLIDGLGWNPERFPGYGALMRYFSSEARRRGIRIGVAGYSEGYGAMWLETDGPKFANVKNDQKYPCFGLTDSPQRECGTCLSNREIMEDKKENIRAFVEATEPGFLYVHGADISTRADMDRAWSNRCDACRAMWPSDDPCATNGAAGSFAYLYDELKDAVSTVRNPDTGYDASRDLLFLAVGPNYTNYHENEDEWKYHLSYYRGLSSVLRNHDIALMLREQYVGDEGKMRCLQMKEVLGANARLAVIEFCAGDGFYNFTPATGEMALCRFFEGCDIVFAGGGNAFSEPRQALWAEYEWNPSGSAYAWDVNPASRLDVCRLYKDLSNGRILPDPIFHEGGLLSVVCAKLYGEKAGRIISRFLPPEHLGIPDCDDSVAIILPLASERLPGSYFSRFRHGRGNREIRWREDLDGRDMRAIRVEVACERASVAKTQAAAVAFRWAADVCDARRDSLLRMARTCDTAVEIGNLTVRWLELLAQRHAFLESGEAAEDFAAAVRRLETDAKSMLARFREERRKMVDASGGQARDALMSALYLVREAENMRTSVEKGVFPPHPLPAWW